MSFTQSSMSMNLDNNVTGVVDAKIARGEALQKFNQINWGTYTNASSDAFQLSDATVKVIKEMQQITSDPKHTDADIDAFLSKNGPVLGKGLIALLKNVTDPVAVRYGLACIEYLLPDGARFISRVDSFAPNGAIDAAPFMRLIKTGHGYAQYAAADVLARLLTIKFNEDDARAFLSWIISSLELGPNAEGLEEPSRGTSARAAVNALMILMRNEKSRPVFATANGLTTLATVLRNASNHVQLSYEVSFVLWTLTFDDECVNVFKSSGAVAAIVDLINSSPREKIVRVCISALKNLTGKSNGDFDEQMIDLGLMATLEVMKDRKWSDEEIAGDISKVHEHLRDEYKELSSVERYEKEVNSGELLWGFLHTDKFWRENIMHFEEKDFETIKKLIELLDSENDTTVAVALFDLGEFMRYYPNGKLIIKRLKGKNKLMGLMSHNNPEVQKQALASVSKMMITKWDYVK